MTDRPFEPADELANLGRRLRQAVEVQGILRDGRGFPSGSDTAPVAGPSASGPPPRGPDTSGPAPPEPPAPETAAPPSTAPEPAARVAPASGADLSAAPVLHSWQADPAGSTSLGELHDNYAQCQRCPLGEGRTKFVFGVGNPKATVVFVGEAPGRDEDLQGEPFVGRAGKLLDKILEAIEWQRSDVYIANILKCRPPGNRNPEAGEIAACEPILRRQIELIRPVILCTLGSFAAKTLLGTTQGISKLRGRLHDYRGIPVVPTYHPAALLRNPNWKRPTWEDVQMLQKEHDRLVEPV